MAKAFHTTDKTVKDTQMCFSPIMLNLPVAAAAICALLLSMFTFAECQAQKVYQFVEIPSSARAAALGGIPSAIDEADLGLAALNPALLPSIKTQKIAADYTNYISDISLGHATYCFQGKIMPGTLAVGIQYLNGGKNTRYDSEGNKSGDFSSNEFALNLSYGRQFDSCLSIGATLKPVISYIGGYSSVGLLADVSACYTLPSRRTTATLLMRNMGTQLTAYYDDYGKVPFEILLAIGHKLEFAPFRFSFALQNLQKYNLKPKTSNKTEPGSEVEADNGTLPDFADNALRHCVFGLEFFPGKPLNLRAGFNYQRRQELKIKDASGLAGISLGFGLRLKKFSLEYAHARYTLAGASNHFSLTVNLPY